MCFQVKRHLEMIYHILFILFVLKYEKSFIRAGDMKKHGRIHSGGNPYHCESCEQSFDRACTWKDMRGYTVEKSLTSVGHVKSYLPKLVNWKDMRGYTVEKNLTAVGHVTSHLPKLVNWKPMGGYTLEKNLTAVGHVKSNVLELVTWRNMRGYTV